jgi:type IV secretory pathway TraG/TraD family ATPase VirD4
MAWTFNMNIHNPFKSYILLALIPFIVVYPLQLINVLSFDPMTYSTTLYWQNCTYAILTGWVLINLYFEKINLKISISTMLKINNFATSIYCLTGIFEILLLIYIYKIKTEKLGINFVNSLTMGTDYFKNNSIDYLPLIILLIVLVTLRSILKKNQFDESSASEQTSGNFGTASWASRHDLTQMNVYNEEEGYFTGYDQYGKSLYFPLLNKLTLSPPGGGKTTASSIPILLSHDGPVFVFDIKGELWAVTARFRAEQLGREIVVIDPFGVTKRGDFSKGKSDQLLKEYRLNPFDWIPEDKKERDRMINTFAASFVINEGGSVTHFDENAKILIRGFIDYIMTLPSKERNLNMLFHLMSEKFEEAEMTFNQMSQQGGRAASAANQIMRVGSDERGSILSTSYRQIDWMGDSNLQGTLSDSNFDLQQFLKGNMDIYVVLPEDQVQEHNRLFRMLLSILMGMLVKANPNELPKKKMLFLLEELAQLGYTPDVEKCIEVLRARGVVIWTVFQTLSQIELFEKPDLFKGAPLKQIFTNDDTKTMEWIQTLGGKKTVLTKTLSTNKGDSKQKFQAFGGTVNTGDGESIHETGVDLIPMNEIRELPFNEQIIFLHGMKPIRCKKVRYFEHAGFKGKFDINPLEVR